MEAENDLNLKATELRLGLPGTELEPCTSLAAKIGKKRCLSEMDNSLDINHDQQDSSPAPKAHIVGWPPVRSYRKNIVKAEKLDTDVSLGMYVKVSMDGAPYLRKIDLRVYKSYQELLKALENMFKHSSGIYLENKGYTSGSDYVPTYKDKDGDWMLVGDVPWAMFINSCRRLRIMKGYEAKGLACLL
ncbi:PREDICTED: auxin-induced protein 22D-like [Nicotiana attenuata]|uniref:Auxin-responsive protein n=1 Tax=Nicotiana attenuata TaxID=49451 RepID=A0A1J6IP37_NICAT|nr:PREDICTED: auxin-induced protein 22D-like [Nicotiana attenuata]OIT06925.1 auxin-induced protein 22d [Nicotiana attenuata]